MAKNEKTKPDRYRATFYFEGKQYESASSISQIDAEKKAAIKEERMKRGEICISPNMKVADWAKEWLETYKVNAVGEGQYKNYLTHINKVIIPTIGNKKVKDVRDIDLQKILNSRANKSKSDLYKLQRTIKAIFRRARISRLIIYDPAEDLVLPAAKDGTHRSITPFEREWILKMAEQHRAGLWIKIMLYCGLRPGETRALDWCHVDFKKKLIHVRKSMKASSKEIGAPKSDAGVRDIPIPNELYKDLLAAKGEPDEPVFVQPTTGLRHTKQSMNSLWKNFKREWDIAMDAPMYRNQIVKSKIAPDLVPYCLRHTYGTDLQDAGVPINVAKYLMGHSSITMTANIYTHTTENSIKDAAKKINKREAQTRKEKKQA